MKILIISTNAIGDTYFSTAAVDSLRLHYGAEMQFTFLIAEKAQELINCILKCETYTIRSHSMTELIKAWLWLRKRNFDLVFQFIPGIFDSALFMFSNSKIKAGYVKYFPSNEWHNKVLKLYTKGIEGQNKTWQDNLPYSQLIGICLTAIECDATKIKKPRIQDSNYSIPDSAYIVIHPVSRAKNKSLNGQSIKTICNYLKQKYQYQLIVVCSEGDLLGEENLLGNDLRVMKNLSISELAALINKAKLFIGVDSFPLHLADSNNGAFIGIFGPTKPGVFLDHPEKSIQLPTDDIYNLDANILVTSLQRYCVENKVLIP